MPASSVVRASCPSDFTCQAAGDIAHALKPFLPINFSLICAVRGGSPSRQHESSCPTESQQRDPSRERQADPNSNHLGKPTGIHGGHPPVGPYRRGVTSREDFDGFERSFTGLYLPMANSAS
jgi:hypothetical protein